MYLYIYIYRLHSQTEVTSRGQNYLSIAKGSQLLLLEVHRTACRTLPGWRLLGQQGEAVGWGWGSHDVLGDSRKTLLMRTTPWHKPTIWAWFIPPSHAYFRNGLLLAFQHDTMFIFTKDVIDRQNYCNTDLVFASPWPFRGCTKPS